MQVKFKKVKTEHTILSDFTGFLLDIEKAPQITRIIPWRISRQQKGSSQTRFSISYPITTGLKCVMSKGSTAQELFVVCRDEDKEFVAEFLLSRWSVFYCKK